MIIASNFKTNHTRASTREFVLHVDKVAKTTHHEIRIFPTATGLDSFTCSANLKIGAQNFYPAQSGSFTGEIGVQQLEEFGIKSVLLGHSERRIILGESDEFIVQKFNFAKENGLEIMFCIGEDKDIRERGIEAVMEFLYSQLDGIDTDYENLIVAYEPIWAIGTGLSAMPDDINATLSELKAKIKAPILYGGSVKNSNIKEILRIKSCDGVLIGSASWDKDEFCKIITSSNEVRKG